MSSAMCDGPIPQHPPIIVALHPATPDMSGIPAADRSIMDNRRRPCGLHAPTPTGPPAA